MSQVHITRTWLDDGDIVVIQFSDDEERRIPYAWFTPTTIGPDFSEVVIIDAGHAIRLGKYEAAADAIHDYKEKQ